MLGIRAWSFLYCTFLVIHFMYVARFAILLLCYDVVLLAVVALFMLFSFLDIDVSMCAHTFLLIWF